MTVIPGAFSVKCNTGVLKRDTVIFGKMSPFCQIVIGTQIKVTTTHEKGGKTPNWNGEVLEFDISDEQEMKLTIFSESSIGANDFVGEAIFFIQGVTRGEIK